MRLLAVADIHGQLDRLLIIENNIRKYHVDLLIIAGDLTARGKTGMVVEMLKSTSLPVFLVKGNADSSRLTSLVAHTGSVTDLHLNRTVFSDIPFVGLGGALPIPFYAKIQFREQTLLERVKPDLQDNTVLVTHTPPRGSVDKALGRFHAGSKGLGALVDEIKPKLVICGHIHEDIGVDYRGPTCVVNCSMGNHGQGVLIDLHPDEEKIVTRELK